MSNGHVEGDHKLLVVCQLQPRVRGVGLAFVWVTTRQLASHCSITPATFVLIRRLR